MHVARPSGAGRIKTWGSQTPAAEQRCGQHARSRRTSNRRWPRQHLDPVLRSVTLPRSPDGTWARSGIARLESADGTETHNTSSHKYSNGDECRGDSGTASRSWPTPRDLGLSTSSSRSSAGGSPDIGADATDADLETLGVASRMTEPSLSYLQNLRRTYCRHDDVARPASERTQLQRGRGYVSSADDDHEWRHQSNIVLEPTEMGAERSSSIASERP